MLNTFIKLELTRSQNKLFFEFKTRISYEILLRTTYNIEG